jgi:DNA-binding response OmpR family regulator
MVEETIEGEKAGALFEAVDNNLETERPNVLLLDLNLPKPSGQDVLGCLRRSKTCQHIPVLIIISSDQTRFQNFWTTDPGADRHPAILGARGRK